jgi:hypothetical protein
MPGINQEYLVKQHPSQPLPEYDIRRKPLPKANPLILNTEQPR